MKGESHEIQISTSKMVKTAQKTVSEGQKGKVGAYSKKTKQNSLALKANRSQKLDKTGGNRDSTLGGCTQGLMYTGPRARAMTS